MIYFKLVAFKERWFIMKMIIAIVQSKDSNRLRKAFAKNHIQMTQLSTTGGFLREGNATFLIGIEERFNTVHNK